MKRLLILILLVGIINAVSFNVYSEKAAYEKGSIARIFADIENDGNETLSGTILSSISSDNSKYEAVIPQDIILDPGNKTTVILHEFEVTDSYPPEEYEVTATMYSLGYPVGYGEDSFMISGTAMDMNVWLISCNDAECNNESTMFLTGETSYIGIDSEVEGVSCTATVITPSGKSSEMQVPGQILLEEKGTYRISSVCSKQGYNTATPSLMVGALDAWPNVKVIQNCNENGVCDNTETHSNCPQDCRPESESPDVLIWIIGAIIVLIIAICIWKFVLKK